MKVEEHKGKNLFFLYSDCGEYSFHESKHDEDKPYDIPVVRKTLFDEVVTHAQSLPHARHCSAMRAIELESMFDPACDCAKFEIKKLLGSLK